VSPMPSALMMLKIQAALTPEAIDDVRQNAPELIDELNKPRTLVDLARRVADLDDEDRKYLEAIPPALREGTRAAIASAIEDRKAINVSFSPGYDFEVRLSDYVEGITVHLSGPYPPTFPRDGYVPRESSR
jgi:hypothetical protein